MRGRSEPEAKLRRLAALASTPDEQARYALELLQADHGVQVALAAIDVFVGRPEPAARPILLRRYAFYDADWLRRDPGGLLRSGILRALRHTATRDDLPLLERAATTYEFMPPGRSECAEAIRAAAVVTMNEVDDELASYHCARLLAEARLRPAVDEVTRPQSGEPAVTAIRVLASQRRLLPLYSYVLQPEGSYAEVTSEALRCLTDLPASLLPPLVERFRETDDEIVLLGLFDLILGHEAGATFADFVGSFLRTTRRYDIYRYLVAAIVASRNQAMLDHLLLVAEETNDRHKVEALIDLLAVRQGDRRIDRLLRALRTRRTLRH